MCLCLTLYVSNSKKERCTFWKISQSLRNISYTSVVSIRVNIERFKQNLYLGTSHSHPVESVQSCMTYFSVHLKCTWKLSRFRCVMGYILSLVLVMSASSFFYFFILTFENIKLLSLWIIVHLIWTDPSSSFLSSCWFHCKFVVQIDVHIDNKLRVWRVNHKPVDLLLSLIHCAISSKVLVHCFLSCITVLSDFSI